MCPQPCCWLDQHMRQQQPLSGCQIWADFHRSHTDPSPRCPGGPSGREAQQLTQQHWTRSRKAGRLLVPQCFVSGSTFSCLISRGILLPWYLNMIFVFVFPRALCVLWIAAKGSTSVGFVHPLSLFSCLKVCLPGSHCEQALSAKCYVLMDINLNLDSQGQSWCA